MTANTATNPPTLQTPAEEPVAGNYFVAAYPPFSAWDGAQVPALHEALDRPALAAPIGLYVHLPFCHKKCDYCYYLSYIAQPAVVVERYLNAVAARPPPSARRNSADSPVDFRVRFPGTASRRLPTSARRVRCAASSWTRCARSA